MNIIEYAREELKRIGGLDDPYQQLINSNILELIEVFDKQGHSGFSANYLIPRLARLLDFKPLTPLTGEEDEWNGNQNKRCFSVFRNPDGTAYDIEGKIFSDDGGETWFTSKDSWVPVEFPYVVPNEPEKIILD